MSMIDNTNLSAAPVTLNKHFTKYVLFFGLVSIILGILILIKPLVTIEFVAYSFAVILIVVGLSQFVYAFNGLNGHNSVLWKIIYVVVGALSIILGVSSFVSQDPAYAIYLLATYIGVVWLMRGFVALFLSFQIREAGLGIFNFLMSIVGIIAGVIMLSSPFFASLTLEFLVLFTGIILIVTGIFEIIGIFLVKKPKTSINY